MRSTTGREKEEAGEEEKVFGYQIGLVKVVGLDRLGKIKGPPVSCSGVRICKTIPLPWVTNGIRDWNMRILGFRFDWRRFANCHARKRGDGMVEH